MEWNAEPEKHVNGIAFGTPREEVRKVLNTSYTEYTVNLFSENSADNFGFCHVHYTKDNRMKAVEIFSQVTVNIQEKKVFPENFDVLRTLFDGWIAVGDGYCNTKYSLAVEFDSDEEIESLLIGCPNYYEGVL